MTFSSQTASDSNLSSAFDFVFFDFLGVARVLLSFSFSRSFPFALADFLGGLALFMRGRSLSVSELDAVDTAVLLRAFLGFAMVSVGVGMWVTKKGLSSVDSAVILVAFFRRGFFTLVAVSTFMGDALPEGSITGIKLFWVAFSSSGSK